MEHLLILLVGGLIVLVRKLLMEGGLAKMLGKLDAELNQPDRRSVPPLPTRQMPSPRPVSLNPEEERMRKFREALGLPPEDVLREKLRPIAPASAPPLPGERARRERERIERKLAEKKRALQQRIPPPLAKKEDPVAKYFELGQFNQPGLASENAPVTVEVDTPIIEQDFYKTLGKKEPAPPIPAARLAEIFGAAPDLRRLMLAQEVFGRPKSLQNA